jgi:hypothetical protein
VLKLAGAEMMTTKMVEMAEATDIAEAAVVMMMRMVEVTEAEGHEAAAVATLTAITVR